MSEFENKILVFLDKMFDEVVELHENTDYARGCARGLNGGAARFSGTLHAYAIPDDFERMFAEQSLGAIEKALTAALTGEDELTPEGVAVLVDGVVERARENGWIE